MSDFREWTPVVFHKRTKSDVPIRKTTTQKSVIADVETYKLAQETEHVIKQEHISSELRNRIVKARIAAKLTQVQLAHKINELPKLVQDYENGKATPKTAVLQKMSKVLGVVLKEK